MSLTEEQKEFFNEQGYLVIENVFSSQEIEQLCSSLNTLVGQVEGKLTQSTDRFKLTAFGNKGQDGSGVSMIQQIAEPHEMGGDWMALARDPRILDIVEGLLGPNIQLYYSMLMMKPPRQGFRAPWHQDFAFFVHNRADILACMVALDDATLENGCIRVVPGSHQLGLLNHFKDGRFTEIVQGDTSTFDEQEVTVPVKAGGLILWHSLTLHSSHANRSERARRAIVLEYKNPETRLMGGAFNSRLEVRNVGLMVRGRDPSGDLVAAM